MALSTFSGSLSLGSKDSAILTSVAKSHTVCSRRQWISLNADSAISGNGTTCTVFLSPLFWSRFPQNQNKDEKTMRICLLSRNLVPVHTFFHVTPWLRYCLQFCILVSGLWSYFQVSSDIVCEGGVSVSWVVFLRFSRKPSVAIPSPAGNLDYVPFCFHHSTFS